MAGKGKLGIRDFQNIEAPTVKTLSQPASNKHKGIQRKRAQPGRSKNDKTGQRRVTKAHPSKKKKQEGHPSLNLEGRCREKGKGKSKNKE